MFPPEEQQVVRLQALLEASRLVHGTIELPRVLQQAARLAVLELEMDGAVFTEPRVGYGVVPEMDPLAPSIIAMQGASWAACGAQTSRVCRDFF